MGAATTAALARISDMAETKNRVYRGLRGRATGIAASAEKTLTIKNDLGSTFFSERLRIIPQLNADITAALAGTRLGDTPDPTEQNNTLESDTLVRIQVKIKDQSWFNEPVSVAALMDDNGQWFTTQPVIPSGANIQVTIYNDTGIDIACEVFIAGYSLTG